MHSRIFIVFVTCTFIAGCSNTRDKKCKQVSQQHVERAKSDWKRDYTLIKTEGFYSKKFDACVHVEIREVGIEIEVRDLSYSILKDGGNHNVLLHCDENGADNVRIDKVQERNGRVLDVPYKDWLGDGYGGLPRTLKTAAIPFTRSQCNKVLEMWLSELRK